MKYLLSTGLSTDKFEYYIIDLFKLYLTIYPKDIPFSPNIGFNFSLTNIKKDELLDEVKNRVNSLIDSIKNKFKKTLTITIKSLDLIDETKIKLIIDVNKVESDEIMVDI